MRAITYIIVHCADTKPSMDIGFTEIDQWHEKRGWCSPSGIHCGYHYIIRRDGVEETGRPESEMGAHVAGNNSNSIGICLVGGMDINGKADANFTIEQYLALRSRVNEIRERYPKTIIEGHRAFSSKSCPCFDVKALLG